jgi:hypothetical protein
MRRLIITLIVGLSALLLAVFSLPAAGLSSGSWLVVPNETGDILQIHYGNGTDWPQYGALHLNSSYFRLNYGPTSGWGTSIILLPSLWITDTQLCPPDGYCQGAPINATSRVEAHELVLSISGTIAGLNASSEVRLQPPIRDEAISALVTTQVQGSIQLDLNGHPNEAFKPVLLSSMHVSPKVWDTEAAYACLLTSTVSESGWIFLPPSYVQTFGLHGGTSTWKTNAPTIEAVLLDRAMKVTGWVTPTNDPNNDNVGLWATSDHVLSSWRYLVRAAPAPGPKIDCLSVSKQAPQSPAQDGAPLTYTIRVTNTAGVSLAATITDILPDHVIPTGIQVWMPTITAPGGIWMETLVITPQMGYSGSLINEVKVSTEEGPVGQARVTICANRCIYHLPVIVKGATLTD